MRKRDTERDSQIKMPDLDGVVGRYVMWNTREWGIRTVWPEKNRQMSIKVAQKWFHYKNDRFWHLSKNCVTMQEIWAN